VKTADVQVFPYAEHGVKLYGNVIIASPKFVKERPEALKAFLRAFTKGAKEVLAQPDDAIAFVKERDGLINADLEKRRLRMAIADVIASPDARADGFGQLNAARLSLMASQVSDTYATKTRVDATAVWNGGFLPSAAELNILPKK
jgi:NitT/TauT family transport system substrate-binding protein